MSIPLTELVVSIIGENRQILQALKEIEVAKDRALKDEGTSGLQRELEQLAKTATEANRKLEPLAGQARATAKELQTLSVAIKTGATSLNEGLKRYQALEAALKAQVGALDKAGTGYTSLSKDMRAAAEEGRKLEALNKALNASYKSDELTRYARGLTDVLTAERAGLTSKRDAITQLKSYQSALAQQTGAFEKNSAEHRAVVKVMGETGAAIKKLEAESDRLEASFRADYLRTYAGELKQIDAAVKSGTSGFDRAVSQVDALSRELKEQQAQLGTTGREFDQFSRLLQSAATQQERYQRAAEQAQRANDTAQIRTYGTELKQLEATLRDATTELGRLDAQQRAIRYDATGLRTYRTETEQLERAQQNSLGAFTRTGQALAELQTRMRDYAQGANLGARESETLARVMLSAEGAATRLAAAQEKAQASYRSDTLRQFRTDLEQIVTSNKNGVTSFEQTQRAVDALQGRMREFGSSVQLTVREQGELARVMGATEAAARNLASAQERAQSALQAEQLVRYNAALLDLKRSLEAGSISQEQFSASARELAQEIERSRANVEQGGRAYVGYTQALTRVDSSLAQAEGRVRRFGVASGVTAGIGDQLQNVLYRMGPAGEAMGVAMFSASAGMSGAATSAKLLNVALAVGLVGAIIGLVVGTVALGKNMYALDTGLADVAKTTGFTQTELRGLAGELQQIALNTGTPVKNLLDLATVAGSLGVTGVKNVAQFTDVMNKLAIASDIVGEEGATQLAKFINVTRDAGQSVGDAAELVGNVIVRLGNSLAATEAPILAMAQRLAGLKTAAGVSQTDILGLAGAFVSLGVSAELGGTNVTKIFTNMSLAASRGGAELKAFADAAGLTTAEFQRLVKERPADAFIALVEGLKRAKDAGQDINPVLSEIVGKNSEMRRVLLAAVGGFDTFTLAMSGARDEAERMTAMNNELQTRLESLSGITSQIGQVFRYAFDSLALAAIPALKGALTGILDFSRGVLGLEQTGDRVETFSTKAGRAVTGFATSLVSGQAASDTFADKVAAAFGRTYDVASSTFGLINVAVLIGLRGALSAGVEQIGTFTRNVAVALSSGGGAIGTIFTNLGTVVQNTVQFIGGVLNRIPAYYQAVQAASGELSNSVSRVFTGIGDILTGFGFILYGSVVEPFINMLVPIRQAAGNVLTTVQNWVGQIGKFFEPVINLARSVGVAIGDFFGKAADVTRQGINDTLSKGVTEFVAGTTTFNDRSKTIQTGLDLIGRGYSGAANAVGDGQNALTRALATSQTALEASVDDADGLTQSNQALGEQSQQTADDVAGLTPEIEGAGGAAAGAVAPTSEYAQKLKEMGPLLTDLTTRFRTTKLKLEVDNDPQEAMRNLRFVAEKAGAAAEQALREGKLARAEALLGLEAEARAEIETLKGVIREGATEMLGSFNAAEQGANNFSDSLGRLNQAAATQNIINSIGTYETFAEKMERLRGATDEQAGSMYASTVAFEQNRIAAINATNVGQSYVDSIIRSSEATWEREKAERAAQAAAYALMSTSYDLSRSTGDVALAVRYTSEQYRIAGETTRTTNTALQEAANRFNATGDAVQFNADKTEIYRAALETLYRAGIDPATVGLGKWVTALGESEDKTKAQAEELKKLEDAAKKYGENMDALRGVQDAFNDGISLSEIDQHIADLEEAAKGHGLLGEKARETIAYLKGLKLELQGLSLLSSVATTLAETFDTTDSVAQLDKLKEAKDELLESGNYDGADLKAMNEDIAALEQSIGDSRKWEAAFSAISDGAEAAYAAIESGASTSEAAFAALGAGVQQVGELFQDNSGVIEAWAAGASNALNALAQGNFVGFVAGVFQSITGMIKANSDEWAQYETIVRENGKAVAEQFSHMSKNGLEVDEKAYNKWVAAEKKRAEAHEKFIEDWKKRERERVEAMAEANREMAKLAEEAKETLGDLRVGVNDARLEFAKANGADEGLVFISETILAIRAQSAEFQTEMARITADKNAYITQYLLANPGASRGEAEAAAEAIFGPQREALKEQFALTASTILIEGAEQAKELGLTQKEFYEAVLSGNTELLGTMTEGQRLAMVQFIELAQELGIELPKAITDAMANVNEAQGQAGEDLAQGQQESAQRQIDTMKEEKAAFTNAWSERATFLKDKIATSTGETKAMYEEMFRLEQLAYLEGINERNGAINEANQALAANDIDAINARLKVVDEALKTATGSQKESLLAERAELVAAIDEGSDGVGSAIEADAQKQVDSLNTGLQTLNSAWATRSAQLKDLIASSSGAAKAEYERQYREESLAYNNAVEGFMTDLQSANQRLLDAQDKGADDFVAAQEEVGRREQEALDGVFTILRQVLGPDAQLIIDMIQRTYNGRREAYLAEGQATAEAAGQANQGELDSLDSVYETLRQVLGPDAQIIIDMIKRSYEGRQEAYNSGGPATANAAEQSAESERTSIANINQMLVDILGPAAAGPIKAMILAAFNDRAGAYQEGGANTGAAAGAASETERTSIANINQMLVDILGPAAAGPIKAMILAAFNDRAGAYEEGGAQAGTGAAEGGETEAQGVDQGTETTGAALERRDTTLAGLLARDNISPALRAQAQALQAEFISGANMTAAEIATARDKVADALIARDARVTELVGQGKTQAEAVRIADGELADTLRGMGEEVAGGATQGGVTAAGGITASQDSQLAAIERLKSSLVTGAAGIGGQVTPAIAAEHQKLMDAFIKGAQASGGGIDAAERAQIAAMQKYQTGLNTGAGNILTTVTPAVGRAHEAISGAFGLGANLITGAVGTGSTTVSAAIGRGYSLMGGAQTAGSGAQVAAVQRAAQVEEAQFRQQSAALVQAINNSKGAERDALIREYQALQQNHQRESSAIQGQYTAAGKAEAERIKTAFGGVATVTVAGGKTAAAGTKTAYGDMTDATNTGANAFGGVLGGHKTTLAEKQRLVFDTQKDVMIARREVLRSITRQSYQLLAQENSHGSISVLVPALNASGTRTSDAVVAMHEKIRTAITRQTELTRAAIRAQTTTLNAAASGGGVGATADAGGSLESTSMQFASPFAPTVGAFAADGIPDYTSATGQVRAYAAATGSLIDLFGDTRSLTLSTMQERALTLNFNFSSLTAALNAPIGILERAANLFWESAKVNMNAVREFSDAVDRFDTKAKKGTYEMARRPEKRKL